MSHRDDLGADAKHLGGYKPTKPRMAANLPATAAAGRSPAPIGPTPGVPGGLAAGPRRKLGGLMYRHVEIVLINTGGLRGLQSKGLQSTGPGRRELVTFKRGV